MFPSSNTIIVLATIVFWNVFAVTLRILSMIFHRRPLQMSLIFNNQIFIETILPNIIKKKLKKIFVTLIFKKNHIVINVNVY